MKKVPTLVVSLASGLRPLIVGLNRELLDHGADPVQKEEWPVIDEMLHEDLIDPPAKGARCVHCAGYLGSEMDGELMCLNCGRSAAPRKNLAEVVEEITQRLIERRRERSESASTKAQ